MKRGQQFDPFAEGGFFIDMCTTFHGYRSLVSILLLFKDFLRRGQLYSFFLEPFQHPLLQLFMRLLLADDDRRGVADALPEEVGGVGWGWFGLGLGL